VGHGQHRDSSCYELGLSPAGDQPSACVWLTEASKGDGPFRHRMALCSSTDRSSGNYRPSGVAAS